MAKTGKTWWGRRFIDGLQSFLEPGRLARGRQYLSGPRVVRCEVSGGRAEARIRARVSPYFGASEEAVYDCRLDFAAIPDAAWDEAIRHIGGRAGLLCRLLVGEMPDEIDAALAESGVSLLPRGREDFSGACTCPDPERPCKHLTGLYFLLAQRLDQDPFLLFELRGLPRAELARRLRATPLGSALASALTKPPPPLQPAISYFTRPVPLERPEAVAVRDFWRGDKRLPPGVEPPQPAAVAGILIRKGGDYPPFWGREESFVETMEAFYEEVRKKAGKEWL